MHITVAICTWNRAKLLDQTLAQMQKLRVPEGVTWELLVVNNNSTDDTEVVLDRYLSKLPLRRFLEPRQGQSHARNCAIQAAAGEFLIWTDDDVLVDPEWLASYSVAFRDSEESVAFWGGSVEPWFEKPLPRAMARGLPEVNSGFCGVQVASDDEVDSQGMHLPMGANFAVRAAVARRMGFDPTFGKVGASQFTGDDFQFMRQILAAGLRGRWVTGATVKHYVCPSRLRLMSILDWYYQLGRTKVRLYGPGEDPKLWGAPRWMYRRTLEYGLTGPWSMICGDRAGVYRKLSQACFFAGTIQESWRVQRELCDSKMKSEGAGAIPQRVR